MIFVYTNITKKLKLKKAHFVNKLKLVHFFIFLLYFNPKKNFVPSELIITVIKVGEAVSYFICKITQSREAVKICTSKYVKIFDVL